MSSDASRGALPRRSLFLRALPGWALTPRRLAAAVRGAVLNLLIVGVTVRFLPGVSVEGWYALVRLVVLIALFAAILRPLLFAFGVVAGGMAVFVLGIVAQAGVMYAALETDPGVHFAGFPAAFAAAWIVAGVSAVGGWLTDAGSEAAFFAQVLRQVARNSDRKANWSSPGVLFVQLDGLSAPLLRFAISSGALPTVNRWVSERSHRIVDWTTGLPSTTPGSQAGILHRASGRIPGFRWFEKDTGRLMVANRTDDAAAIEHRLSDGHGLLACPGGFSLSNVFSGDAELSILTFSHSYLPQAGARGYARFLSSPQGFSRAFVLTIGAMASNYLSARKQAKLRISPRVPASGSSVALRALSTVLLRDLDVTLVAEQMAKGAPRIYVDFVDYDEVAHHAGPTRPESLRTLQGLDGVLRIFERLASAVGRHYEIVVLSDHGQAQGPTFKQKHGQTLEDLVAELVAEDVQPDTAGPAMVSAGHSEAFGPINALLTEFTQRTTRRGRARRRKRDAPVTLGPGKHEGRGSSSLLPRSVVACSGNLGLVYLPEIDGQASLEWLCERHPRLVTGLSSHPGIGFVVVRTEHDGPVALGASGRHRLRDGQIEGDDPLLPYGREAARILLEHQSHDHTADITVISAFDRSTGEVCAFEELVGSHGGLGGDQTKAFVVHPSTWRTPEQPIRGADELHDVLVGWLADLQPEAPASSEESAGRAVDETAAAR